MQQFAASAAQFPEREGNTITGRDGRDLLYGAGTLINTIVGLAGDDGVFGSGSEDDDPVGVL